MKRKPDKYDKEIAVLRKNPRKIFPHWVKAMPLFGFCGSGGCLTQIRNGDEAETPALTKAIRADSRIPRVAHYITVKHLPVFAMWQRRLDRTIRKGKA